MSAASINVLTPQQAAGVAKQVYATRTEGERFVKEQFGLLPGMKSFELQNTMEGIAGPRPVDWSNGFGYIARGTGDRKDEAIVATRGTANLLDLWTDGNGGFTQSPSGFMVHCGFNDTYRSFRADIMGWFEKNRDIKTVHCVGHSLGAALATLAADDLSRYGKNVALYSFGSPRVGTDSYASYMRTRLGVHNYRVHCASDPVTMVGPWMYTHLLGANYTLPWKGWSVSLFAHFMDNYIKGIGEAGWAGLAQAAACKARIEAEVKAMFDTPETGDSITMYSTAALGMIAKCLGWLLETGATAIGAVALAGMTVIDQLSYMLYASAALANPGTAVVLTLKWIMKFLGRNAETIKDASLGVIRWCLSLFLNIVSSMARRAVYQTMYMPIMM
jgi:pimeloyl-ACP methyl ester carboxylesterase